MSYNISYGNIPSNPQVVGEYRSMTGLQKHQYLGPGTDEDHTYANLPQTISPKPGPASLQYVSHQTSNTDLDSSVSPQYENLPSSPKSLTVPGLIKSNKFTSSEGLFPPPSPMYPRCVSSNNLHTMNTSYDVVPHLYEPVPPKLPNITVPSHGSHAPCRAHKSSLPDMDSSFLPIYNDPKIPLIQSEDSKNSGNSMTKRNVTKSFLIASEIQRKFSSFHQPKENSPNQSQCAPPLPNVATIPRQQKKRHPEINPSSSNQDTKIQDISLQTFKSDLSNVIAMKASNPNFNFSSHLNSSTQAINSSDPFHPGLQTMKENSQNFNVSSHYINTSTQQAINSPFHPSLQNISSQSHSRTNLHQSQRNIPSHFANQGTLQKNQNLSPDPIYMLPIPQSGNRKLSLPTRSMNTTDKDVFSCTDKSFCKINNIYEDLGMVQDVTRPPLQDPSTFCRESGNKAFGNASSTPESSVDNRKVGLYKLILVIILVSALVCCMIYLHPDIFHGFYVLGRKFFKNIK